MAGPFTERRPKGKRASLGGGVGQAISSANISDNRALWVLSGTQGAGQAQAGGSSDYFIVTVARAPVNQEESSPSARAESGSPCRAR